MFVVHENFSYSPSFHKQTSLVRQIDKKKIVIYGNWKKFDFQKIILEKKQQTNKKRECDKNIRRELIAPSIFVFHEESYVLRN